jgi:uncharacterized membrane protein YfcA
MDFPLSLFDSLMACFIAVFGATLQGSIGFGLGLIGVPLLVLINSVFIPGPLLLAALCLTLLLSYREHHAIHVKGIKWAIPGRIVGSVIGAALLTAIPQSNLSVMFGIMVLLAVVISIVGIDLPLSSRNLFGAAIFSGFMGTTSAIGGAPMALVYQRQKGPRIRGTLSAIFVFGTIIALISLAVIGRFGFREIQLALVLLPGIIIGFSLSRWTAKILDQGFIRQAVLAASAVSGIVVIIRNIF